MVLLTLAAVVGFSRLFAGSGYLGPLLVAALGSHGLAAACRRRGWGVASSAAVVVIGLALVAVWGWYRATTALGVPTATTVEAVQADLDAAWQLFAEVVAPAPPAPGFVLMAAAGVAAAAFLADWAAHRVRSAAEAIAPSTILFVFGALLGAEQHVVRSAVLYTGAVLLYLLVARVGAARRDGRWQEGDGGRGAGALLRGGALIAALSVVVAAALGPRLPGADDPALVAWRGVREQPGSRVTVSPLVDIRSRLVTRSDVEVLTVRSTQRAYWRLTSLDTFDGTIWKSGGRYGEVGETLPVALEPGVATTTVEQSFDIEALAQLWLPAAYEPRAITTEAGGVRYEVSSGTLIVDTAAEDSDGMRYAVTSALPHFDPDDLRSAPDTMPSDIRDRYLELPPAFSPTASELAVEVTSGASGPYEQALALQSFFRDGFTYDLDIGAGHGGSAIERFLTERRGYCEQFSGTYAAMARSIGLPARVAVGFTPGEVDAQDPNLYHVRGEHAHAWPEVWISGAGWVAMEPTPGRGAPGAEAWTGVPEQQDGSSPVTPTTAAGPATTIAPGATATTTPADAPPVTAAPATAAGGGDEAAGGGIGTGAATLLAVLLGAVALWAVAIPAALLARRALRRRRAPLADAKVLLAWRECEEALAACGALRHRSETHREFAARAQHLVTAPEGSLTTLADLAEIADYGPGCGPADVDVARGAARSVTIHLAQRQTLAARLRRWLDPAPLLPASRRRTVGTRTSLDL